MEVKKIILLHSSENDASTNDVMASLFFYNECEIIRENNFHTLPKDTSLNCSVTEIVNKACVGCSFVD